MREIQAQKIKNKVKELFLRANYHIGEDVLAALKKAREKEVSKTARLVLDMLIENHRIAAEEEIAICQDTGLAVLYVEVGQEIHIAEGNFQEAVNEGVRQAYVEGYLRKSAVNDPVFARKNTKTNTPAIIYTDIVPGDKIKFMVIPKGFGSENMSALAMMKPAEGAGGIEDFVVDTVRKAGPNPCPPTIVGVGIGGTADKAFVIAKKALLRGVGEYNKDKRYARMEKEILEQINNLGIGPAGLGGRTTALAVNIEYTPTHIAGMPVAVNVCCHASRHAEGIL
ncbi:fumarate hydratase [Patescibacteria group bacterium]|nr:fumarate hydratase [Patescibacteria group bacterium]